MTPRDRGRPGDRIVVVGQHRLARRRASALALLCAVSIGVYRRPPLPLAHRRRPPALDGRRFPPDRRSARGPGEATTIDSAIARIEPAHAHRRLRRRHPLVRAAPDARAGEPGTGPGQDHPPPADRQACLGFGHAGTARPVSASATTPTQAVCTRPPARPLRVGDWRGRRVQVCGGGGCIVVTLIDWCACGGSHVIDLYSDAFQRLAPLSSGAVQRHRALVIRRS